MAFYLVMSLAATAGLFFLAGADFVGSMQILIYVGGTLVLLVFGVMLTSQDRFISMKTSRGEMVDGGAGRRVPVRSCWSGRRGACRSGAASTSSKWPKRFRSQPTATPIGMGLLGVRVDRRRTRPATCWSSKSSPCICWSCLIGAAYLARAEKQRSAVVE